MKPIYIPKGKAKEYGDYAINIYTGCPHECYYCFAPNVLHKVKDDFHKTRALTDGESEISIAKEFDMYAFIYNLQEEAHRFAVKSSSRAKIKKIAIWSCFFNLTSPRKKITSASVILSR